MAMFTEDGRWSEDSAKVLADLTTKALMAAYSDNDDEFSTTMIQAGTHFGERGIFVICQAICGILKTTMTDNKPGFASLVIPDGTAPEAFPEEMQTEVWAIRFVVSGLNGDHDNMLALWMSRRQDAGQVVENVVALFGHVVGLMGAMEEANIAPWT